MGGSRSRTAVPETFAIVDGQRFAIALPGPVGSPGWREGAAGAGRPPWRRCGALAALATRARVSHEVSAYPFSPPAPCRAPEVRKLERRHPIAS
jgi:hypothetical protein